MNQHFLNRPVPCPTSLFFSLKSQITWMKLANETLSWVKAWWVADFSFWHFRVSCLICPAGSRGLDLPTVQSAEGDFFMFSVPKASKRALGPVNRTRNEKWRTLRKSYKWLCFGHNAVLGQFCFTVGYLVVFFVATCSHRLPFILLGVLTHTRNVQFKRDIEKTSQISSGTDQNKCFWFLLA